MKCGRKPYVISKQLIESMSCPEPNTGCWLWLSNHCRDGYGRLKHDGSMLRAHRLSYELFTGAVPTGMFVCHKCDTPACVNPAHLFAGTPADNSADCSEKRRRPYGARNHKAKLSLSAVREIRAKLASGAAKRVLAREYGVDQKTIYNIARGRIWTEARAV